jgi:hypothetical protein
MNPFQKDKAIHREDHNDPSYGEGIKLIHQYDCVKCQSTHFEGSMIYQQHVGFQSKHGIKSYYEHIFCPICGSKDFSGCPACEDYL